MDLEHSPSCKSSTMFALDDHIEHPSVPGRLHGVSRNWESGVLEAVVGPPVVCPKLADQAGGHVGLDTIQGVPKKDAYCAAGVGHSDAN